MSRGAKIRGAFLSQPKWIIAINVTLKCNYSDSSYILQSTLWDGLIINTTGASPVAKQWHNVQTITSILATANFALSHWNFGLRSRLLKMSDVSRNFDVPTAGQNSNNTELRSLRTKSNFKMDNIHQKVLVNWNFHRIWKKIGWHNKGLFRYFASGSSAREEEAKATLLEASSPHNLKTSELLTSQLMSAWCDVAMPPPPALLPFILTTPKGL